MTTAGDKIYIINGRVMTGWSMYFSLTSIKSPENYSQIVDIVYNVPYIFAAIQKRATLALGARFDIVDDPAIASDEDVTAYARKLVFDKLNVNGRFLKKISAHMDIYGNAYVHIRRSPDGTPDKLTILQPERMKIFLDPMTTKILFYVYLPPIIGGTLLVPYPYEKPNPNIIQNIALTYPTPIIVPPEDIMHLKQNDWTEYPFGFSLLRAAMEPAQARLDYTIISPIIYKHYSKPIIHWTLDPTGLNPNQVKNRMSALQGQLESMEPTSDMITTNKWANNVITGVSKGFSAIFDMIADNDTQIFACLGVPETYFKARGTTDRMVAEQDKIFIKEMKDRQEYFGEEFKTRVIYPAVRAKFGYKRDETPHIRLQWRKMIMTDESIEIQNTIAMLQAGVIDMDEARRRLSLPKTQKEAQDDLAKKFIKESTPAVNQQIPSKPPTPIPMGSGDAAPSAPKSPEFLFADEQQEEKFNRFQRRAGESDELFAARLESMSGKRAKAASGIEIADDQPMHIAGRVGKVEDYSGPVDAGGESISKRKCPFCRKQLFVSQDTHGDEKLRCERHGFMQM